METSSLNAQLMLLFVAILYDSRYNIYDTFVNVAHSFDPSHAHAHRNIYGHVNECYFHKCSHSIFDREKQDRRLEDELSMKPKRTRDLSMLLDEDGLPIPDPLDDAISLTESFQDDSP